MRCSFVIAAPIHLKFSVCLSCTPKETLKRLQLIQNRAARLITLTKAREHITPVLRSLHWLPVKERILFKVACLIFKCQHQLAPDYLSELISEYIPSRSLRSANGKFLVTPVHRLALAERAFSVGGPKIWNSLSLDVRNCESLEHFKSKLKTELFQRAYVPS